MDAGDALLARLNAAPVFVTRSSLLRHCAQLAPAGIACEFGVFEGHSLRQIRNFRKPPVFGFDTFTGLPSKWNTGGPREHPAGTFACQPPVDLPVGTHLVAGLFADTLPRWLEEHDGPIRFAHIDCDLYDSTRDVLRAIGPRLVAGSVLLFDELVDWTGTLYPNWRDGEFRALVEWLAESGRAIEPVGRTDHQQAAFVLTN